MATDAGQIERVGRFEIVRKLASGGMGTVCLASLSGEAGFRRMVALKRLHPHLCEEPDFVHMFFDEARLAARIHHPNVVPILEIGKEGNERFLVMEYVEGVTAEQLRSPKIAKPLPVPVTLRIVLDALMGLHAAHILEDDTGRSLELVHRDVSPQNILVGVDGTARLTDFGIARAASRISRSTLAGTFKGKLCYSAPEQLLGRPMDRRTDVYAMGIVLWELLTGARLFDAEVEGEVYEKLLNRPIPSPDSARSDLAMELVTVCMGALRRPIGERYASAAVFADALEAAARASVAVATHREVSAYVTEMVGERLTHRREKVREWIAQRDATGASTTTVSSVDDQALAPTRWSGPALSPSNTPAPAPLSPSASAAPPALESAPSAGSDPRLAGSGPLPYHWSMRAALPVPPAPKARTALWIAVGALAALAVVAALAVPALFRGQPAGHAPITASPPVAVDPPPAAPDPGFVAAAPPTGAVAPSAATSATAPRRPVTGPRPTGSAKNAEFGDRW